MNDIMNTLLLLFSIMGGLYFIGLLYAYVRGLLTVDEPSWSSGPINKRGRVIDGRSISASSIERMHRG